MDDARVGVVLREVFSLLDGVDLAACICVCRQWRDVGREDFFWRRLCQKQWPSTTLQSGATIAACRGYRNLFSTLAIRNKRNRRRALPVPKLCFADLEFYVDVWVGDVAVYSAIVAGPLVKSRIQDPPAGICDSMQQHLKSNEYKMTVPVSPPFEVSLSQDTRARMSMLVRRKDSNQVATIIQCSSFDYVDGLEHRAHAYDYLQISPLYPFFSEIRAWVALLLVDNNHGNLEVFGIELDFLDTASSDDEVLCLLDILDWK